MVIKLIHFLLTSLKFLILSLPYNANEKTCFLASSTKYTGLMRSYQIFVEVEYLPNPHLTFLYRPKVFNKAIYYALTSFQFWLMISRIILDFS